MGIETRILDFKTGDNLSLQDIEKFYLSFHSHPGSKEVLKVLELFDVWKRVNMGPDKIGKVRWWFCPPDCDEFRSFLNLDGKLKTVEEVARNFSGKIREATNIDQGFVRQVLEIRDFITMSGELPEMIMVSGRNPLASPSLIDGYHRSLAIGLANIEGNIKGKTFKVLLGRKNLWRV